MDAHPELAAYVSHSRRIYTRAAIDARLAEAGYGRAEIDDAWRASEQASIPRPARARRARPLWLAIMALPLVVGFTSFTVATGACGGPVPDATATPDMVLALADSLAQPPIWSYAGDTGPAYWGDLDPAYAACRTGKRQSPIDFTDVEAPSDYLIQPIIHLGSDAPAFVVNDWRYVRVAYPDQFLGPSELRLHMPSEHTINGMHYEAELQFMLADNLIASVLLTEGIAKNAVLDVILDHLPGTPGQFELTPEGLDLHGLLPHDLTAYNYYGSLTTPPCAETITWIVYKTPVTVAAHQLAALAAAHQANNRPLQARGSIHVWVDEIVVP